MPVIIYGRLITHSWEATLDSGEKITRSSVKIKASHVGVDLNKIVITSAMTSRLGRLVPLEIGSFAGATKGPEEVTNLSTDWDGTVAPDGNPFPEGSSSNSSTSTDSTDLRDSAHVSGQEDTYSRDVALASA